MTTIPGTRLIECGLPIVMHNRDNDYNIDHIAKEKLEQIGKLPDVMDVVEDVAQLFNMNDTDYETNDMSNESDDKKNT